MYQANPVIVFQDLAKRQGGVVVLQHIRTVTMHEVRGLNTNRLTLCQAKSLHPGQFLAYRDLKFFTDVHIGSQQASRKYLRAGFKPSLAHILCEAYDTCHGFCEGRISYEAASPTFPID